MAKMLREKLASKHKHQKKIRQLLNHEDEAPLTTPPKRKTQVAQTVLCSDGTTIGYDDWNAVAEDIETDAFGGPGVGGTFVLCPNTTFDTTSIDDFFNEALIIYQSNVIIQCGSTGSSENNCVVNGDATAIEVQGVVTIGIPVVPTGIEIRGLSFVGDAERGAPLVAVNSLVDSSQVEVIDCIFANATNDIERYGVLVSFGAVVTVSNCVFENNQYVFAVYATDEGSLVVVEACTFLNNEVLGALIIADTPKCYVSIMQSCFIENKLLDPKSNIMIFLEDSENLIVSEENYAEGNINSVDPALEVCNGISSIDTQAGMLMCEEFTEAMCKADVVETSAPTPAPIASPSTSPTASPSAGPTASPSVGPTASPSAGPTASPTNVMGPTAGEPEGTTSAPVASSALDKAAFQKGALVKNVMVGIFAVGFLVL